jgi:type II secretory pathway component GspD/PulD (secretin)
VNLSARPAKLFLQLALALTIATPYALSQATDEAAKPEPCPKQAGPLSTKTFYLANTNTNNSVNQDGSELLTALRNILCPTVKVYLVSNQSAIVMQAPADQLALAQRLITDLDRPKKTYRLTYTITELDSGKPIGNQHFSMVVVTGQKTTVKEGDKIPVATGTYSTEHSASQTQFTYLDVGMSFAATLDEFSNGVRLQSKVEQSSVGPSTNIAGVMEPVVRQAVIEGTSFLTLGKPVMLGSVDVPNSTRHLDIDVVMDQVK